MSKCVWALEKEDITDFLGALQEGDARAWLAKVLSSLPQEDMVRVVVTLWAVWHARRKALHENNFQGPLSTHVFINRFITDLGESTPVQNMGRQSRGTLPSWIPPPQNYVKVNVDAAISKNSGFSIVAAVARDETGTFIGTSTVVSYGVMDPETMEVMACREGLALASDLHIRKVRVASDCSNVIRSIGGAAMAPYGHIIQEIKAQASSFQKMEFVHERREANYDAHNLARRSLFDPVGRHVWFLSPSEGVCNSYSVAA